MPVNCINYFNYNNLKLERQITGSSGRFLKNNFKISWEIFSSNSVIHKFKNVSLLFIAYCEYWKVEEQNENKHLALCSQRSIHGSLFCLINSDSYFNNIVLFWIHCSPTPIECFVEFRCILLYSHHYKMSFGSVNQYSMKNLF